VTTETTETRTERVKARALIGNWEDQEPMLLGAIQHDQYEAILVEDAADGTERWEGVVAEWTVLAPSGITETREVDLLLAVPADLFSTPQLTGTVEEAPTHGE
jgi:hypothetical protein